MFAHLIPPTTPSDAHANLPRTRSTLPRSRVIAETRAVDFTAALFLGSPPEGGRGCMGYAELVES